jgi:hypothetical protein
VSDRLEEIRARLDAATPGPWEIEEWMTIHDVYAADGKSEPTVATHVRTLDADLIAHAPADIAWLLAEVERWKHVAKNNLYGVCWCDAPRHDCCLCPGTGDDSVAQHVTKQERP